MKTIYELQQIANRLRQATEANSISPEDTFGLQSDVLEYLADMEQNAEGLGIHKVYASYAAMVADASAPVGSNGKALRFGQLVVIYNSANTSQAESGNVYAWQKGNSGAAAWLLMGNLGSVLGNPQNGYYVCDTAAATAEKEISATGYVLSVGGSMKVKMTNANTVDNATLNINSTGVKPLFYDGERASANNSWEAGETVEVYYDGTSYYANSVAGGSGSGDGAFDVSAKYPTSGVDGGNTYTLDGALAVLNANLSANKKKGGMSIKFIQSSDNNYIQFRCMAQNFTTDITQWQGVDDEPTAGSENLVKSGGVYNEVRPFIISGTTQSTWKQIWDDANNPIPAGSIIENDGDLDVNVFDSMSTSQGSYNHVLLPANSSLTCEWAVYRIKITNVVGSYSLKVHKNGTLEGRVSDLEEKVKDISSPTAFVTGEQVSDVSIVDDLSSETSNAVPSVEAVNSKFEETDDAIQELNNKLYGAESTLPTVVGSDKSYPARYTGEQSASGYYRNYTVDLTGAYARGFRKVVFYGFSYQSNSDITQGLIATGKDGNDNWIVESYIPLAGYQAGYCELPITANSTTLVATIIDSNRYQIMADKYPESVDVSYVPSTVTLVAGEDGLKKQVQGLDARVAALEEGEAPSSTTLPIHYFPSILYGVIGETQQEFVRGMVASMNPYQYYNKFVMSPVHGKVYKRYLEITPELVNGQISSGAYVKHCVIDDWYNTTPETNTPIKVTRVADLNVPSGGLNVLCVGASTTVNGQWVGELYRRLTANDGTPTGYGLSNINFVGRKTGKSSDYSDIHLEATGGWTWERFYTPQDAIRFYVSGNPTVDIGTTYTFTGVDGQGNTVTATIAVAEVNVSGVDGEDNIRCIYTNSSPIAVPTSQSGTLTGSGGNSITYVDYSSEGYAPFEDDGEVTFVPYVEAYCGGKLDVLCCFMGSINIPATHDNDLNPTLLSIKLLLDTLHSEYPNCKVLIGTAIPFSTYYGLEDDYGAGTNPRSKYIDATLGAFRYVQMVDDLIAKGKDDNNEPYSNFCYLVNTFTEVDSENVFPITTKAANTRMPDLKEVVGTNGAHPNLEGFMMIADSFCRTFANEILTNNN